MNGMLALQNLPLAPAVRVGNSPAVGTCLFSVCPAWPANPSTNPWPNHTNPPRWLELLRERTRLHSKRVEARLQLFHLDQLHHTIRCLGFMQELPGDLRTKAASILINISDLRVSCMGETWMREHERAEKTGYILLQGTARIQRPESPDGICPAPELMGETMQFNPAHERIATVSAAEDCMIMSFAWDDFWARVEDTCTEEEQESIRTALQNLAWDHLTRPLQAPSPAGEICGPAGTADYAAAQPSAISR